jgi:NitT/TauT family transport system ATP-binding protein
MSSRPGRIINEWQIASDEPRRIESKIVSELSLVITEELRKEIKRHG